MFTTEELQKLAERAKTRPRVAKVLGKYLRHVARIQRLERVLDPNDTNAVLLPKSGTPDTVREEIARRKAEMPTLERALRKSLAAMEV